MIRLIIILTIPILLCGCKTTAVLYDAVPNEEDKWIAKKKMELRGIGKIEADFEKNTIKRDSGLSIKMPDIDLDVDKLGN